MQNTKTQTLKIAGIVGLSIAACAMSVYAGTGGEEFQDVYDLLEEWATGTLGKIIALGALIVGIGFGLVRQSVIAAVVGIAMALVLNFGPTVISGIVTATASTDVLGYSNGVIVDASYSYPFRLSRVALVPTVGLQWTDVNYNDYYYGVAASEARKSGFSEYTPDGCVSPYAGVTARMQFTDHVSGFASARALFLNQEITDSPMVDTSEKYSLSLGVMYKF